MNPTRTLSHEDFLSYFSAPMKEVTGVEGSDIDIWPYVDAAVLDYPELAIGDVSQVYVDGENRFHHITIDTDVSNVFLIVIVDLSKSEIAGHHLLNLRVEYGL